MQIGISNRVGVGVVVPVFISSENDVLILTDEGLGQRRDKKGATLGDIHMFFPIRVMGQRAGRGVALMPWFSLPSGNPGRFLGDRRPGMGASVVGSWIAGPLGVHMDLGPELRGNQNVLNIAGGLGVRASAGVSYAPRKWIGLHAESRVEAPFAKTRSDVDSAPLSGVPIELFGAVRGAHPAGVWMVLGGGLGVGKGAGAANRRLFLGVGGWFEAKTEPSVVEQKAGPQWMVIRSPKGNPVPGARVYVDDALHGQADADGRVPIGDVANRSRLRIEAPGFGPVLLEKTKSSTDPVAVVLRWLPATVQLFIRNQDGEAVAGEVEVKEASGALAAELEGPGQWSVTPGVWTVKVKAEGHGVQERTLEVAQGVQDAGVVELILLPKEGDGRLDMRLATPEGRPISGAVVHIGGRPIGTTGSAGDVHVGGLADQPVELVVQAVGFNDQHIAHIPSTTSDVFHAVMNRQEGSVQIRVRTAEGPAQDASVRLMGPDRLGPFPMGHLGERTFVLRPGRWDLLVSSPKHGMQERSLQIVERSVGLLVVDVVLVPAEDGTAELELRVVDVQGKAVAGAKVALDGQALGATSNGGGLRMSNLLPGLRQIEVHGDFLRSTGPMELVLVEGVAARTVVVQWKPGSTAVSALTPLGPARDGRVRFQGPEETSVTELGASGRRLYSLAQGEWHVLVSSPSWGLQERSLVIPADSQSLHHVDVVFQEMEAGGADLELEVLNPEGAPVAGAEIVLDGQLLGRSSSEGTVQLRQLAAGVRQLVVRADLYADLKGKSLTLKPGEQTVSVGLKWRAGATRVRVSSQGEAVSDAMVRFAGETYRPPSPVDRNGEFIAVLEPGSWELLVSSATHGLHQQTIVSSAVPAVLTEVEIELPATRGQLNETLVRIQDPDGHPVQNATLSVADQVVRTLGAGGMTVWSNPEGEKGPVVEVTAPHFETVQLTGLGQALGYSERVVTLPWTPIPVQLRAVNAQREPVSALVRLEGPGEVTPQKTGPEGELALDLRPGRWTVLVTSKGLGTAGQTLELKPGVPSEPIEVMLQTSGLVLESGVVRLRERVHFEVDSAKLGAGAREMLTEAANTLRAHPEWLLVEVQGHTDSSGSLIYNQQLSEDRAEAVRAMMVELGVAPERVLARGYGRTRPIQANDTADGRSENRRVEFEVRETVEDEKP